MPRPLAVVALGLLQLLGSAAAAPDAVTAATFLPYDFSVSAPPTLSEHYCGNHDCQATYEPEAVLRKRFSPKNGLAKPDFQSKIPFSDLLLVYGVRFRTSMAGENELMKP